ncbi:MAG: signal peptidase I [Clostridia bacterium]|nr:signal peptidase I [Clostridia bacterium]
MYKIDKIEKENQRIHIVGKIMSVILYMILIPIIIFNFTLIIKSFINPNETPDFLGYKSYVIVSGSMEPTIQKGDAIFVKDVPEKEIQTNDIISFTIGETNVTHRIIQITEDNGVKKYKTKGDNNNTEDKETITYQQIEGKYQFKINQFGLITQILKSKITLIILVFIIIFISVYKSRMEHKKQERKEKRKQYEEKNQGEKEA